jgi:hypothetical protein
MTKILIIIRLAMYVYRNTEARSCNNCCIGKAISIIYSKCMFVALCIQHAMHMRHIVPAVCPALHYFSTLSHKQHDFRRNVIEYTIDIFIFSTKFVRKFSHSKKNLARCDQK